MVRIPVLAVFVLLMKLSEITGEPPVALMPSPLKIMVLFEIMGEPPSTEIKMHQDSS